MTAVEDTSPTARKRSKFSRRQSFVFSVPESPVKTTRLVEVSDVNSSCASDQEQQPAPESQTVVENNSPAAAFKPAEPERSLQVLSLVKRGGLLAVPQMKEQ